MKADTLKLYNLIIISVLVGSLRTDNEFLSRFLKARKMNTNDAFELYENYYRFVRRNSQLYNDRYNVHNSEVGSLHCA